MAQADTQDQHTHRIAWLGDVDSTNAEALRRAQAGERGPIWIFARRQLAGRGRRGRPWASEAGNLYASLLFEPRCAPRVVGQLSFVISLALHDAICRLAPLAAPALALKWPNDLLLNGAKVSGILIESAGSGAIELLVIGCGVNCAIHPQDTPYPATDFAAAGYPVAVEALAKELPAAFERWLRIWQVGANFAEIRACWLERATGMGQGIVVRLSDGNLEGQFEGLGEDGELLLRLPDGSLQHILAGDVFLAAPHAQTTQR